MIQDWPFDVILCNPSVELRINRRVDLIDDISSLVGWVSERGSISISPFPTLNFEKKMIFLFIDIYFCLN